jgi:tetratricopeptide (TPR) repeat protein
MKPILISCLLLLSAQFTFAQNIEDLYKAEKYREVIKIANQKDSFTSKEQYRIGRSYFNIEEYENALTYFNKAIVGTYKDSANAYFFIGLSHKELKSMDSASVFLKKAMTMDTTDQYFFTEYATLLMLEGKFKDAIPILEKAVTLKQEIASPYFLLPYAHLLNKNKEIALTLFNKYLPQIQKDEYRYISALKAMASLERDNKDYKQSISHLEKLLELNKQDFSAMEGMMITHSRAGDFKKAEKIFDRIKKNYEDKKIDDKYLKTKCTLIDQFNFDDTTEVSIVKYFEKPKEFADPILKAYIINIPTDSTTSVILTEKTLPGFGISHILCGWRGHAHLNFGTSWKDDNIPLKEFEEEVVKILTKRRKIAGSTTTKD